LSHVDGDIRYVFLVLKTEVKARSRLYSSETFRGHIQIGAVCIPQVVVRCGTHMWKVEISLHGSFGV
jgi:hypothetical protein